MKKTNEKNAKNTIEYIAYLMNKAKENQKPIVFLGAGASASAGIPLANQIVEDIKLNYKDNPAVKDLIAKNEEDYYVIMQALTSEERKDLFYEYITDDKVKINVTNIYLAQLLREGYVDYILTVNFDDLILRACALFNFLPPVYDISNVKLPTTSNYREKSVIYMHGQHYGQWLLNNKEELEKAKKDVSNVFGEIKAKRTWIVVGYSGQDEIFNQLVSLGSFSNELFWINYLDSPLTENVENELISKSNTNANLIKGYDSDSFFLKLHSELGLQTPDIFNKPFTFLKEVVANVKDIEEIKQSKEHKDLYVNVKERMDITNKWIDRAISEIQEDDSIERFKQEIIEAYTKKEFEDNESKFLNKIKQKAFEGAKEELADFFLLWGDALSDKGELKSDENLFKESFSKYKKAIILNPKDYYSYCNWGTAIFYLAELKFDENLYIESLKKYKEASKLKPKNDLAYNNWTSTLLKQIHINKLTETEKIKILEEAKEKALKAYKYGGKAYNLSCVYALQKDKNNALKYLKESLGKKQVPKEHILEDKDWQYYQEDKDFKTLIANY